MIENPIVKEPPATYNIPYLDTLSQHEKIPGMDKYIAMWKETERRESRRSREVPADASVLDQSIGK
jgi:hypothetical protein